MDSPHSPPLTSASAGSRAPNSAPSPPPRDAALHPCPVPLDECTTAQALLMVGRLLFAERGYEGTSVRSITDGAQANLAAVTYHFGSKRALYEAVLADTLASIADGVSRALRTEGPPLDRIVDALGFLLRHFLDHPEVPRLMFQELSSGGSPAPPVQSAMGGTLGLLVAVVEEGQADGSIRAGDPILLAMSVISQPVHLSLAMRPVGGMMGILDPDTGEVPGLVEHARTFARRALAATPEVTS